MMFELSKRLSLIASFVNEGSDVCDVGTDHGYLPAFLYISGKCKTVTATDINSKPLESARKNLKRLGADNVNLILCDGLEGVDGKTVDTIIIAGMGGEVISGIIERANFLQDSRKSLILQPTTSAKDLRIYLSQKGFVVERETAISENGKIYSVMLVRFAGTVYNLSDTQELIGILKPDSDDACQYIKKQHRIITKRAADIQNVLQKADEYKSLIETAQKLEKILEA